jgi:hypothetical protein
LQTLGTALPPTLKKLKPPNHNAAAAFPEAVIPDTIIAKYIAMT